MPMNMKLDESIMVYPTKGIIYSKENEPFTATHVNTNESQNPKDGCKHDTLYTVGHVCTKAKNNTKKMTVWIQIYLS